MFYSEFLIFSAYLVLTNMEAGALYQTEYGLIEADYSELDDGSDV